MQPSFSQDLRFSQWHASETFLNPAFAGAAGRPRVYLNFRDQWPDMPQTYVSYRAAFDMYLPSLHSGLGIFSSEDAQGNNVLTTTTAGIQYMYQARFNNTWALNTGLQFSYTQIQLNWYHLQFYDQINLLYGFNDAMGIPNSTSEIPPPDLSKGYFDMGAGTLIHSDAFFAGISVFHLTRPDFSFYGNGDGRLPMTVTGHIGYRLEGKSNRNPLIFSPFLVYTQQGDFTQAELGCYLRKSVLLTGLFVKHNTESLSDVVFLAGLSKGIFSFAYSYDLATGALAGETGGAHEVSIILTFRENKRRSASRKQKSSIDCPSIL